MSKKPDRNPLYYGSKISTRRFRKLLRAFAMDLTATDAAELTSLSVRSTNDIYLKLRRRIAARCAQESPFAGEVEVDESYFGPRRVRGKRGRGAAGKTIVFGVFKRDGCVYTEIVPDCRKRTLQQVIRGRVSVASVIHSDGWRGYDGLVDVGYEKHLRVNHDVNQFTRGKCHVNGIESFWSFAKRRLVRFNGVPARTFALHLKECEFRFNCRRGNLYRVVVKMLQLDPL